jgi:tripartite-type tricarboxylate transporter receptor subunit TctC
MLGHSLRVLRPAVAALALVAAGSVKADEIADFYRGKTVTIVVGYSTGGGYDLQARALARYWPKYIPGNPNVLVQNMPGAASVVAANTVNKTSPRDGTVVGIYSDSMVIAPLMKMQGAQFDPRQFGWIGSLASRPTPVIFVRSDSPGPTFELAQQRENIIGALGPDASSAYANLSNDLFGTKFRIVTGYKGGPEILLAIARGEVHGRAGYDWPALKRDRPEWLRDNFIRPLIQVALTPDEDPLLKDVPVAINLAKTAEDKQILELVLGTARFQRAFSTPEGVPPARLEALRASFKATMSDPGFVFEMDKLSPNGVTYAGAQEIEAYMKQVYAFPAPVVERASKYFSQ